VKQETKMSKSPSKKSAKKSVAKKAAKVIKNRKPNALHEKLLKLFMRPTRPSPKQPLPERTARLSRRSISSSVAVTKHPSSKRMASPRGISRV
jgi:hypothetical protein